MDQRGYSVLELLVYLLLSAIVIQAIAGTILSFRLVYHNDTIRTRLSQNLLGGANILTHNLEQAGEYLPRTFPVIELTNGASGAADTLISRKGMIQETLTLCQALGTGAADRIYVSSTTTGVPPSCVRANITTNYNAWKNYRTSNGNSVKAFIYDVSSKKGEFFNYIAETDTGTLYYLTKTTGAWTNTYSTTSTTIYLIEEFQYSQFSDRLEIVRNGDTSNPLKILFGLTNFQVSITTTAGTVMTAFARTDLWSDIKSIDLTLSGSETASRTTYTRTTNIKVFPRNIMAQSN